MSFWIKLGAITAVIITLLSLHTYYKRKAVKTAVNALKIEYKEEKALAEEKANRITKELLSSAMSAINKKDEEIKEINSALSSLSDRLRERPSREDSSRDTSPTFSCTGAELSREDGEFLAREAARADRILKERDYYYERYEEARKALAAH